MRRAVILSARATVVLLLTGAVLDLQIPGRSHARIRLHLVDRSASVTRVKGPRESLKAENADEIIAYDRETKSREDAVLWASFGRDVAFESKHVDPTGTDLSGALTAALGRNPTEIVLYTDGRADPGDALFLCRERNVPIHVLPIGPVSVRDIRIVRIEAPAQAPAGTPVALEVVLESTYDVRARLRVAGELREVDLAAGVPRGVPFTLDLGGDGRFDVRIETEDACPENNHVEGRVFWTSEKPKLLALSEVPLDLPEFEVTRATALPGIPRPLDAFDAVVLNNVPLSPAQTEELANWVRDGGGLVILGGPRSYAAGHWKGTPLEEICPLTLRPDLRVAAVLGLDASGSMNQEFESAVQVLRDARGSLDRDDDVVAMAFGDDAVLMSLDALRKVHPTGGTAIAKGIRVARMHLELCPAGRKVIVLVTDGETKETPQEIRAEIGQLKDIDLIVVTTHLPVEGARNVPIKDWDKLAQALQGVLEGIQEVVREHPGTMECRVHPVTEGVPPVPLGRLNRTTAKPGALVVATVGRPPAQDPVLALGAAGQGRVAAFAVGDEPDLGRLIGQAARYVAGEGGGGLTLRIDPPFVRARGFVPEAQFDLAIPGGRIRMSQVASDAWEGRLPEGISGTVFVRKGRARAAATIPGPPEFQALGIDRPAIERIARETGGKVLGSVGDLAALPRPDLPAPRPGRPYFLIAALALVFIELGATTFWKA